MPQFSRLISSASAVSAGRRCAGVKMSPDGGVSADGNALLDGLHAGPKIVEGNAVVESGSVNDLALIHLHDPRVAVLVGFAVVRNTTTVPNHDYRVPVRVNGADPEWAEGLTGCESGAKGSQHLVDELLRVLVSLRCGRVSFDPPYHVGSKNLGDGGRALLPGVEGFANRPSVKFCLAARSII